MAAQRNASSDRENLQIIVVNLNGSAVTIQSALTTVQNMMRKESGQARPALTDRNKKGLPAPKSDEDREEETLFPDPQVDGEIMPETPSSTTPTTKRNATRLPKGVPDLDFNSATPTFRELAAAKKPHDQFDWYALVAYWMKKYKQIDEIGLPHIVTAKQYIGGDWPSLSVDAGTPFRDGRRPAIGIFTKGSKNGMSCLTANGEDRVNRMGQKE